MKLEIQNISVAYDTDVVLKQLSLSVREGEFLSLLGTSGCGKSTLLKTIAGILTPSEGRVLLDGRDITHCPVHRRGTVVVFQDMRLFPHMNVLNNVAFPLKMQGIGKAERLETAREMLRKVQMDAFCHRLPGELSGGQQQRVALARVLGAKPKLLLLDEPFSALDENLREEMRSLVLKLHRDFGMTTILVTHDRQEALSMSDRVAVMEGGVILQMDTPEQVYYRPGSRRVAEFFGGCTWLRGRVSQGMFRTDYLTLPVQYPEGEYDLLLRPHNFHPEESGDYPVTVESVRFRGEDTQILFRGDDGALWQYSTSGANSWHPGDRVLAALQIDEPLLFPCDPS